jgi:hypothetical protein
MSWTYRRLHRLGLLLSGGALFLGGCDPQLQATVENGIINASTSLFAAVLQAAVSVALERPPG